METDEIIHDFADFPPDQWFGIDRDLFPDFIYHLPGDKNELERLRLQDLVLRSFVGTERIRAPVLLRKSTCIRKLVLRWELIL